MAMFPQPVSLDTLIVATGTRAVELLNVLGELAKRDIICKEASRGEGYYAISGLMDTNMASEGVSEPEFTAISKTMITKIKNRMENGREKSLILAHLYREASIESQGLNWIMSAAQYLLEENKKGEAAQLFQLVLDGLADPQQARENPHLYMDTVKGILLAEGHRIPLPRQKSYLQPAWNLAKGLKDEERFCSLGLLYGRVSEQVGNYRTASQIFGEIWRVAEQSGNEDLSKNTALMTCDFLFRRGRVGEAIERYEKVLGNLEKFPSDEATLRACSLLGWCYGISGQTARGLSLIEAVRKKTEVLGLPELVVFSDVMSVLTLLEARLIAEVGDLVDQILALPESYLGYFVLWAIYHAKAYILYRQGNLAECFSSLKKAHNCSVKYGWPHHRGPWILECLYDLEKEDYFYPKMNFDSEMERIRQWPDIFMQGVAYRMLAQKELENPKISCDAMKLINKGLGLLKKAGARLELARAQVIKARLLIHLNKPKGASTLLQKAWEVMSPINVDMFPADLKPFINDVDTKELVINTFLEVSRVLGTVRQQESLLKRVIDLSMMLTTAQRGAVFLRGDEGQLRLVASRNLDNEMVGSQSFRTHMALIKRSAETNRDVFEEHQGQQHDGDNYSGARNGWIICVPIALGDKLLGVLYHNGYLRPKEPVARDFHLLRAIGNQVAVVLDDLEAHRSIASLKDRLREETRYYRSNHVTSPLLAHIVGRSDAILKVQKDMEKVANTNSSVLITGETGVGKELVAQGIHRLSDRSDGPFIPTNLASFSEGVVTSELFGHERGAFTGAVGSRIGRFELAHGGTLFLDDIQNLPLEIQAKLLRVLQEKEFSRVGSSKSIKTEFRLVAATNVPLLEMVEQGTFRSDLYYRLNVFPIHIPALRERVEDIPILAVWFMDAYAKKFGKNVKTISNHNMNKLRYYHWPGNIRELKHVIERGVIVSEGESLTIPEISPCEVKSGDFNSLKTLEDVEKSYLKEVLAKCGWKVSGPGGAAELINMKPSTLYSKLKKLGIHRRKPNS